MAGQVSPGIVLRERDLTAQTIVATQSNAAALVGSFERGPVGTITTISTERELAETFGKPNSSNYEDWFTAATYLGYGGQVQINRIPSSNLKNAVSNNSETTTVDESKLYVDDASAFGSVGVAKVDNEYFLLDGVNTSGGDWIWVDTRGILGSAEANHLSGATVTAWTYADSATTTTILEAVDAGETVLDLDDSTGFAANDYARIVDLTDGDTEIVKIVSVEEANQVVVQRGQLGTTALTGGSGYTFTKLNFAATGTTTTLTQNYPTVTSSGSTAVLISNSVEYDLNAESYNFKFAARTAGSWANGYKVAVIDGSVGNYATETVAGTSTLWSSLIAFAPTTSNDVHILVIDANGSIVESYPFLSKLEAATDEQGASRYYRTVIRRKSSLVYAGATALSAGNSYEELSGGVNTYAPSTAEVLDAFDIFQSSEEVFVDFLLCGGSFNLTTDQVAKAQKVISLAEERKDCIAFVSPHKAFAGLASPTAQRDNILEFFNQVGSSSSYAIFDSGYKYIYDRYNDTYRYIPCCGDVAGLCVRTSTTLEDWYSPAGLSRGNLRNAIKLAYVPSKTDRDTLYVNRINPIASFPGQGIVLFGDKTALATPSAFDRINVRRLFLALEKRLGQLAKTVLFELNDVATRASFAGAVNSYMSEVKAKRGVIDYLVVCDESNNTPDVIDRNEFVAEIYVKPTRSINYVTITLVATRTGVSFEEVTGQV